MDYSSENPARPPHVKISTVRALPPYVLCTRSSEIEAAVDLTSHCLNNFLGLAVGGRKSTCSYSRLARRRCEMSGLIQDFNQLKDICIDAGKAATDGFNHSCAVCSNTKAMYMQRRRHTSKSAQFTYEEACGG